MSTLEKGQVKITRPLDKAQSGILSDEATKFLTKLVMNFEDRRQQILLRRRTRQQEGKSTLEQCRTACQKRPLSVRRSGPLRLFRGTCSTGASKSPDPWNER